MEPAFESFPLITEESKRSITSWFSAKKVSHLNTDSPGKPRSVSWGGGPDYGSTRKNDSPGGSTLARKSSSNIPKDINNNGKQALRLHSKRIKSCFLSPETGSKCSKEQLLQNQDDELDSSYEEDDLKLSLSRPERRVVIEIDQSTSSQSDSKMTSNQGFEYDETPFKEHPMKKLRKKMSVLELKAAKENKRTRLLVALREFAQNAAMQNNLFPRQLEKLFAKSDFCGALFGLFDLDDKGELDQADWVGCMRANSANRSNGSMGTRVREFVELLENSSYTVCQTGNLTPTAFFQVWNKAGLAEELIRCMDKNEDGDVTVDEFMSFITMLTSNPNTGGLTDEDLQRLEQMFRENLQEGQEEFTLADFKKIVPSKNSYFVERAFTIFDKDRSGSVSLEEFMETMKQFASQGIEEKISFLFKIYDPNGDGVIDEHELCEVLKACMVEDGLNFDENVVKDLAKSLYQEAVKEGKDGITADDLKEQLERHEGLLENLSLIIGKLLVPPKRPKKKTLKEKLKEKIPYQLTHSFIRNNGSFVVFMTFLILGNMIIIGARMAYFREFPMLSGHHANPFYIISRGMGIGLDFNSMMLLILVLRYTLTMLRNLGLAGVFPLDHNIYFHKRLGQIIFIQAWLHAVMHFINFGINIQPDPVRFVQLSARYWKGKESNWTTLGYQVPPGCSIVALTDEGAKNCMLSSIEPSQNWLPEVTHCQACEESASLWSYKDWMVTIKPGVFGLVGGIANPTGIVLLIILSIIFIGSLNQVRKSGYFQVFYFSHLLNFAYWILLILHAPAFWKWILVPGAIFSIEIIYRVVTSLIGGGKSKVIGAITYPSKVTNLVIRRPAKFNFNPGDWVFIKIPEIAIFEWHAFTISSAPEVQDTFTLHIRGVGQWTLKLYHCLNQKLEAEREVQISRINNRLVNTNKRLTESLPKEIPYEEDSDSEEAFPPSSVKKLEGITTLSKPLQIFIDGPFGSPSSNIYRAEHAVLIGTGIGITPFASILQSIMKRYNQVKSTCPKCSFTWSNNMWSSMLSLKKVDFFWINRDHDSFEWFVKLLTELEMEQAESGGEMGRFLDMHMYVTSALQRTDMKAVMLQLAMDLHHKKEKRDLVTGLKSRMNAGRPNWNKLFTQIRDQKKGKVTVFFCGNPSLARVLRAKADEFGFKFRKEVF